ncbi:MAG: hypothetical protein ACKO25_03355, partial [Cyanobium sp.]
FMPRCSHLMASALLASSGLQPVLVAPTLAAEVPLPCSIVAEQQQQHQHFAGVWALTDNGNNLFNVRLSADGSAVSTSGVDGVPLGGSSFVYTITAAPGSQPTALSGLELRVAP